MAYKCASLHALMCDRQILYVVRNKCMLFLGGHWLSLVLLWSVYVTIYCWLFTSVRKCLS